MTYDIIDINDNANMGVKGTVRTSAIQPLALKLLKKSFSCQKMKNEKNENFLCIFKIFLCICTSIKKCKNAKVALI